MKNKKQRQKERKKERKKKKYIDTAKTRKEIY